MDSVEAKKAIQHAQHIVSRPWVLDVISLKALLPAWPHPVGEALHRPPLTSAPSGVLKELIVAQTGFRQEERKRIETTCIAAGVQYSRTLCRNVNTHCICAKADPTSDKYVRAR
eukprot:scaffold7415_cov699-Prasinococcus_capsulatus_cf.AAC.1